MFIGIICMHTSLWPVMFSTELTNSVAGYVQFVIRHDESNAKGIWVAKDLCVCVCVCVCVLRERERYMLIMITLVSLVVVLNSLILAGKLLPVQLLASWQTQHHL